MFKATDLSVNLSVNVNFLDRVITILFDLENKGLLFIYFDMTEVHAALDTIGNNGTKFFCTQNYFFQIIVVEFN